MLNLLVSAWIVPAAEQAFTAETFNNHHAEG
jgi:hypothetical protein